MDGTDVSTHTISFRGYTGYCLVVMVVAIVFYVLGMGSTAWAGYDQPDGSWSGIGLWMSCVTAPDDAEIEGIQPAAIMT